MQQAAVAYAKMAHSVMSPREAEAAVLLKAATRLQAVQDNWSGAGAHLNEALTFNQKIWMIIAGAATEPTNPLPSEVKQTVARLAAFVFNRTLDAMIQPQIEALSALIRINRELAEGLRGNA